ncbi:hypothetical protein ATW55_05490 [Ferroacidibacillus organovorans]|uniref:Uncharacterized protein n=2 Tax=Ferroacidibacillus organovorans TaxID=1765683 RepID=A0A124IW34_9BACL|nr:hypothetical protein ATW55_05490 [Ferroacidibacillus organovorans]
MGFLDRIRSSISGKRFDSPEHLEGYKRMGEEVFEVVVELADCPNLKARAIIQAARSLQVMADALLQDAYSSDAHQSLPVPMMTHEQAEAWYGKIPDLLVAARQEAAFEGSAKIPLPIRLGKRIESSGLCPVEHLAGMRRAADEMESMFKERMEHARLKSEVYKEEILLYEEARTRRGAGDATVGSILGGRHVPRSSHEEAETQYWNTLSSYLLIAQGLEDPLLLKSASPSGQYAYSKLDANDVWKVTSPIAIREIRQDGEWDEAERDLEDHWRQHKITNVEREYVSNTEQLLSRGEIHEDGYWASCPFQAVYRVIKGPVHVLNHTIPTGHFFVWDYGEDGEPGRFITQASFGRADSRQYCDD